jgi:hypothetical protein
LCLVFFISIFIFFSPFFFSESKAILKRHAGRRSIRIGMALERSSGRHSFPFILEAEGVLDSVQSPFE